MLNEDLLNIFAQSFRNNWNFPPFRTTVHHPC